MGRSGLRRTLSVLALTLAALAALVSAAYADFPYGTGAPHYQTGPASTPNDLERRRQRVQVRRHAGGRQPVDGQRDASCSACAARTSWTPSAGGRHGLADDDRAAPTS